MYPWYLPPAPLVELFEPVLSKSICYRGGGAPPLLLSQKGHPQMGRFLHHRADWATNLRTWAYFTQLAGYSKGSNCYSLGWLPSNYRYNWCRWPKVYPSFRLFLQYSMWDHLLLHVLYFTKALQSHCLYNMYRVANSRMKGSNQFPFCFNFQCSFLESMYFYTYFTDRCIFFFTTSFKTWIPYLFSIFCKSKTLLIGKKVALLEK